MRMTKDDRRQRTKKRMMTHMCIYAKPETDITEGDGNGRTSGRAVGEAGVADARLVTATEPRDT